MQLYKRPSNRRQTGTDLQRLTHGFQLIATALERSLRTNTVISDDEWDEIRSGCEAVLKTLRSVLSRTQQTAITETTDLHRLKDSELAAKFTGCQQDLYYVVDIATAMCSRLVTFGYLSEKEYKSLERYWRSVLRQHAILGTKFHQASMAG